MKLGYTSSPNYEQSSNPRENSVPVFTKLGVTYADPIDSQSFYIGRGFRIAIFGWRFTVSLVRAPS